MIIKNLLIELVKYPACCILWFWNPFPRRWKIGWPHTVSEKHPFGRQVMDIRQRIVNKRRTERILAERKAKGEDLRKCYRIGVKSSIDLTGNVK